MKIEELKKSISYDKNIVSDKMFVDACSFAVLIGESETDKVLNQRNHMNALYKMFIHMISENGPLKIEETYLALTTLINQLESLTLDIDLLNTLDLTTFTTKIDDSPINKNTMNIFINEHLETLIDLIKGKEIEDSDIKRDVSLIYYAEKFINQKYSVADYIFNTTRYIEENVKFIDQLYKSSSENLNKILEQNIQDVDKNILAIGSALFDDNSRKTILEKTNAHYQHSQDGLISSETYLTLFNHVVFKNYVLRPSLYSVLVEDSYAKTLYPQFQSVLPLHKDNRYYTQYNIDCVNDKEESLDIADINSALSVVFNNIDVNNYIFKDNVNYSQKDRSLIGEYVSALSFDLICSSKNQNYKKFPNDDIGSLIVNLVEQKNYIDILRKNESYLSIVDNRKHPHIFRIIKEIVGRVNKFKNPDIEMLSVFLNGSIKENYDLITKLNYINNAKNDFINNNLKNNIRQKKFTDFQKDNDIMTKKMYNLISKNKDSIRPIFESFFENSNLKSLKSIENFNLLPYLSKKQAFNNNFNHNTFPKGSFFKVMSMIFDIEKDINGTNNIEKSLINDVIMKLQTVIHQSSNDYLESEKSFEFAVSVIDKYFNKDIDNAIQFFSKIDDSEEKESLRVVNVIDQFAYITQSPSLKGLSTKLKLMEIKDIEIDNRPDINMDDYL